MALHFDPALGEHVREQVEAAAQPRKPGPPRPITTVYTKALGDLRIEATADGHTFVSDERKNRGGTDTGPAPLRYFLAGVAMCLQVWTIKMAAMHGVVIEEFEASLAGFLPEPGVDNADGFGRLELTVTITSPDTPERVLSVVSQGAVQCAAFMTVHRGVPIDAVVTHNGEKILDITSWDPRA